MIRYQSKYLDLLTDLIELNAFLQNLPLDSITNYDDLSWLDISSDDDDDVIRRLDDLSNIDNVQTAQSLDLSVDDLDVSEPKLDASDNKLDVSDLESDHALSLEQLM